MHPEFPPNIGQLPRTLGFVRDLEEFEGPILTEFKGDSGGVYLEKWCVRDESSIRTLLVRSEQRFLAEYLAGRVSMLELLRVPSDGVGFLVDRTNDVINAVFVVSLGALPATYLPDATAFHDATLRPHWERTPQSFLIGGDWDAKLLATIERRYQIVHAFSHLTNPQSAEVLPPGLLTFNYDGGFPIMHAFNRLRGAIPSGSRAKATGVSANSPGVFTIDAPTETAERVLTAISSLPDSMQAYDAVHSWSRLKPQRADDVPATAFDQLKRLCDALDVDSNKLLSIAQRTERSALLVAGKLVAAYYRQLWKLAEPEGDVEFLGSRLDPQGEPAFLAESAEEDDDDWG